MDRGQVPTTTIEAALGLLLLFSVAFTFALGIPGAGADRTQLDAYAADGITLLGNEPPQHGGETRLAEVVASGERFDRERDALRQRVDRILPANLMFQIDTAYGTVGHPLPAGEPTGTATVTTVNGPVTLRVWYV